MKKIKFFLFLIFIGLFITIVYQNLQFLLTKGVVSFSMYFAPFDFKLIDFRFQTPEITNAMFFLSSFVAGLVIAYFSLLKTIYKSQKKGKELNKTILDNQNEISELKNKISTLASPAKTEEPAQAVSEPTAVA